MRYAVKAYLTTQEVADLVVTAFEGGSNYWLVAAYPWNFDAGHRITPSSVQKAWPLYSRGDFWDDGNNGYMLEIIDEGSPFYLTMSRMDWALSKLSPEIGRRIVEGQYDADDADYFLQMAVFKDIVYG